MADRKSVTALQLFRHGHDTLAIAHILKIPEALALKQLSRERAAELRRGDPYHHSIQPPVISWPAGRVAYAGKQ